MEILKVAKENKKVTIDDLVNNPIVSNYHHNARFYISQLLCNMEQSKLLIRVKKAYT